MTNDSLIPQLEAHRGLLCLVAEAQLDRKLRSKIDAADIVQETMQLAYAKFKTISEPENSFVVKRWLLSIMGNVLIDQRRRFYAEKRDARVERAIADNINSSHEAIEGWLQASQTSPSMAVARGEDLNQLAVAISNLPEDMREVVVRRHINNESINQIATVCERTPASVAGLLRRGLAKLRHQLATTNSSLDL